MKLGVLVSGNGTNLQAILDAIEAKKIDAEVAIVISNRPGVRALERARRHGIRAEVVDHTRFATREDFEKVLQQKLRETKVDLVCLAGFMRILSPSLVNGYPMRMLNIHPSLLPAFPGTHAVRDVLVAGIRETGCTVHFVTAEVDRGPIILQAKVPIRPGDTEETLAERIHKEEHRIYPEAIGLIAAGRVRIQGGKVTIQGGVA